MSKKNESFSELGKVRTLYLRACEEFKQDKFSAAAQSATEALALCPEGKPLSQQLKSDCLKIRGLAFYYQKKFAEAIPDLSAAETIWRSLPEDYRKENPFPYIQLIVSYHEEKQSEQCFSTAIQCLKYLKKHHRANTLEAAEATLFMAIVYDHQKKRALAINSVKEALKIYQLHLDDTDPNIIDLREFLQKCDDESVPVPNLTEQVRMKDEERYATELESKMRLADQQTKENQLGQALATRLAALKLAKSCHPDPSYLVALHGNVAVTYAHDQGSFVSAIQHSDTALSLGKRIFSPKDADDMLNLSKVILTHAEIQRQQMNDEGALETLNDGISLIGQPAETLKSAFLIFYTARLYTLRAAVHFRLRHQAEMIADFEKMNQLCNFPSNISILPAHIDFFITAIDAFLFFGMDSSAMYAFQKMLDAINRYPNFLDYCLTSIHQQHIMLFLGRIYFSQNLYLNALEWWEPALTLSPADHHDTFQVQVAMIEGYYQLALQTRSDPRTYLQKAITLGKRTLKTQHHILKEKSIALLSLMSLRRYLKFIELLAHCYRLQGLLPELTELLADEAKRFAKLFPNVALHLLNQALEVAKRLPSSPLWVTLSQTAATIAYERNLLSLAIDYSEAVYEQDPQPSHLNQLKSWRKEWERLQQQTGGLYAHWEQCQIHYDALEWQYVESLSGDFVPSDVPLLMMRNQFQMSVLALTLHHLLDYSYQAIMGGGQCYFPAVRSAEEWKLRLQKDQKDPLSSKQKFCLAEIEKVQPYRGQKSVSQVIDLSNRVKHKEPWVPHFVFIVSSKKGAFEAVEQRLEVTTSGQVINLFECFRDAIPQVLKVLRVVGHAELLAAHPQSVSPPTASDEKKKTPDLPDLSTLLEQCRSMKPSTMADVMRYYQLVQKIVSGYQRQQDSRATVNFLWEVVQKKVFPVSITLLLLQQATQELGYVADHAAIAQRPILYEGMAARYSQDGLRMRAGVCWQQAINMSFDVLPSDTDLKAEAKKAKSPTYFVMGNGIAISQSQDAKLARRREHLKVPNADEKQTPSLSRELGAQLEYCKEMCIDMYGHILLALLDPNKRLAVTDKINTLIVNEGILLDQSFAQWVWRKHFGLPQAHMGDFSLSFPCQSSPEALGRWVYRNRLLPTTGPQDEKDPLQALAQMRAWHPVVWPFIEACQPYQPSSWWGAIHDSAKRVRHRHKVSLDWKRLEAAMHLDPQQCFVQCYVGDMHLSTIEIALSATTKIMQSMSQDLAPKSKEKEAKEEKSLAASPKEKKSLSLSPATNPQRLFVNKPSLVTVAKDIVIRHQLDQSTTVGLC